MASSPCLDRLYADLTARTGGQVPNRWRAVLPDHLPGGLDLDGLVEAVRTAACSDQLLGPLLRVAAEGDTDAVDLVVCVFGPMLTRLGRRLAAAAGGLDAAQTLAVSCMWLRVSSFPWRTRRGGLARGLALDVRRDALREATAGCGPSGRERATSPEVLAQLEYQQVHHQLAATTTTVGSDMGLVELLAWARDSGVVKAADADLLLDLVAGQPPTVTAGRTGAGAAAAAVGRRRGVSGRTIERHRDRIVARLRRHRDAIPTAA